MGTASSRAGLALVGVAATAPDSIADELAAAGRLGDAALAASAREAFVGGMTLVLIVCAAIAVIGAALTAAFMPDRQPGGQAPA